MTSTLPGLRVKPESWAGGQFVGRRLVRGRVGGALSCVSLLLLLAVGFSPATAQILPPLKPSKGGASRKPAEPRPQPPSGSTEKKRAPEQPPAADGPRYFVLPIKGEIGRAVTAAKVKESLAIGLKDPSTILVLDIDSPGGLIRECEAILELLAAEKDRRSFAYIKSAYSAAAIIALSCDELYLHESAAIGSAQAILFKTLPLPPPTQTPTQDPRTEKPRPSNTGGTEPVKPNPQDPDPAKPPEQKEPQDPSGTPPPGAPASNQPQMTDAHEKLQSVWRSICRRSAEVGGHNPILAEAMANPDVQIRLVKRDGVERVEQFLEAREEDLAENRILKTKGRLLTLTASEAVRCGLARGKVESLADLETKASGVAGWTPSSDAGTRIMDSYRAKVEKATTAFNAATEKAVSELKFAYAEDPARHAYLSDGQGHLTPTAYKLLVEKTTKCNSHLNACDASLKKLIELNKANPFLELDQNSVQQFRVELGNARARIKQFSSQFKAPRSDRRVGL